MKATKSKERGAWFWRALSRNLSGSGEKFKNEPRAQTYAYLDAFTTTGKLVPSWYEFGSRRIQL